MVDQVWLHNRFHSTLNVLSGQTFEVTLKYKNSPRFQDIWSQISNQQFV